MTKKDIIQMARGAGLVSTYRKYDDWIDAGPSGEELVAFAKLVEDTAFKRWAAQTKQAVEAEREACAKVCEEYKVPNQVQGAHPDYLEGKLMAFHQAAIAIRARGNTLTTRT